MIVMARKPRIPMMATFVRLLVGALIAMIFFQLPAFAGELIGTVPEKAIQNIQLAQANLCLAPRRMINGRCKLPNFRPVCRAPKVMIRGVCKLPNFARCRPPKRIINGVCKQPRFNPQICRLPKVLVNGRCKLPNFRPVCRPPKKMINGRCKLPNFRPVCRLPKVLVNGRCKLPNFRPVCRLPKKIINGRCQLPNFNPQICRLPKVLVNGRCKLPNFRPICRLPKKFINGRCRLPFRPPVCRLPKKLINGRCRIPGFNPQICRLPRVLINGRCKLPNINPQQCRLPKKWINGRCRLPIIRPPVCRLPDVMIGGVCREPDVDACERGRVWRNGRCVRPNPVCRAPRVRSPFTGQCYLPFDIVPIPEAQCRSPWYYSARAGGCVKPRPRQRPKENVLWIQSCLNQLGYRAGSEDGLDGRKTRSAWDSFRRGIGELGYAEYNDPVTLAQLYRQCAPGQAAEPRPPVRETPPPLRGDDLQPLPSDGLSYRPAMCATGSLYTLLNKTYGDAVKLEKCGRSCLPVPDGMALSEVRRLESESGVNWCKSCTKIGDEGILCPLPNKPQG